MTPSRPLTVIYIMAAHFVLEINKKVEKKTNSDV